MIFDGGSATLKLDAPAAFTGAIEGLVVGDAIDLAGITASSATYSGSTLTINETNGQQLIYSNVSGSLTGDAVTVASDNNGGTLVYWSAAPAVTPPTISGTVAGQTTTSEATLRPFSDVTIGDANNGGTNVDTLTITLSGSGTLSGAGPLGAGDVYTLTGRAAQLTDALQRNRLHAGRRRAQHIGEDRLHAEPDRTRSPAVRLPKTRPR